MNPQITFLLEFSACYILICALILWVASRILP
jgi:hypothetical protein